MVKICTIHSTNIKALHIQLLKAFQGGSPKDKENVYFPMVMSHEREKANSWCSF